MKTLWKAFKADLQSNNGDIKWELNKWVHHRENIITNKGNKSGGYYVK